MRNHARFYAPYESPRRESPTAAQVAVLLAAIVTASTLFGDGQDEDPMRESATAESAGAAASTRVASPLEVFVCRATLALPTGCAASDQ